MLAGWRLEIGDWRLVAGGSRASVIPLAVSQSISCWQLAGCMGGGWRLDWRLVAEDSETRAWLAGALGCPFVNVINWIRVNWLPHWIEVMWLRNPEDW